MKKHLVNLIVLCIIASFFSCDKDESRDHSIKSIFFIYDIDFSSSIYPGSDIAYVYLIIQDEKWETIINNRNIECVKVKGIKDMDKNKIGIIAGNPILSKNVCILNYEFVMKQNVCEYIKMKKEILKNTELTFVAKDYKDSIIIKPIDVSYYKDFFDSLTKGIARPDNSKCK